MVPLDITVQLLLVLWALSSQLSVNCARKIDPAKVFGNYKIVDLSHHFNNRTIYWEDDAHYNLSVTVANATKAGWYMQTKLWCENLTFSLRITVSRRAEVGNIIFSHLTSSATEELIPSQICYFGSPYCAQLTQVDVLEEAIHGGTHLDAPLHFAKGGWDAAEIPLERLVLLPVAVVDVRDRVASNPEYLLSVRDVLHWEERHGRLPNGCLFLAYTGQSKYWPDRTAYMGIDESGTRHFPAVSPEAASFLVEKRRVFGVGLDSAGVDKFGNTASHRTLLGARIFVLENLNALHRVPPRGAYAIVLPLKLDNASGSPVRVVALVP